MVHCNPFRSSPVRRTASALDRLDEPEWTMSIPEARVRWTGAEDQPSIANSARRAVGETDPLRNSRRELRSQLDADPTVWRLEARRVLDQRLRDVDGAFRDLAPCASIGAQRADWDVALGDLGELWRGGEIVDQMSPRAVVIAHVVAVAFELACSVAPHASASGVGRNGSEDVEVERTGAIRDLEDTFFQSPVEGTVDLTDRRGEESPLVGGGFDRGDVVQLILLEPRRTRCRAAVSTFT